MTKIPSFPKKGQGMILGVVSFIYMYSSFRRLLARLSLGSLVLASFPASPAMAAVQDALIKNPTNPAVYYVLDGKRYVFPNERIYKSWYVDFSSVQTVSEGELASYQIGGNVPYRPGKQLVKIISDPKVYVVSKKGTLRTLTSEAVARELYDSDWATKVHDLSDAFFVNYTVDTPVDTASNFSVGTELLVTTLFELYKGYSLPGAPMPQELAMGTVKITNNGNTQQTFIKTTRILAPNGKMFRLSKTVLIDPGATVEVGVYADNVGADYAIGPTTFTIPGLMGSTVFYVVSSQSFGFNQASNVISGTSFQGCPVFPTDNAWNQRVDALPVHEKSATYIASIGASRTLHPDFGENQDYGIPYTLAEASTPKVAINYTAYGDESDAGPFPIPSNARVESGSDHHVLVVDKSTCMLYELYNAVKTTTGWNADSGAKWNLKTGALRPEGWTSADAAGLPIFNGLVRYDEIAAGKITHAIRVTVPRSQSGHILPATHHAGSNNADLPPMGLRLRLKKDYDISTLTGSAKIIAQAMKDYGMIVADNGSAWYFQGATDTRWNDAELNQLKAVPGSAFEAVYTGDIRK